MAALFDFKDKNGVELKLEKREKKCPKLTKYYICSLSN